MVLYVAFARRAVAGRFNGGFHGVERGGQSGVRSRKAWVRDRISLVALLTEGIPRTKQWDCAKLGIHTAALDATSFTWAFQLNIHT